MLTLTVSDDVLALPDTATGFGLKLPELFDGSPLTLKLTFPPKLFSGVKVTV